MSNEQNDPVDHFGFDSLEIKDENPRLSMMWDRHITTLAQNMIVSDKKNLKHTFLHPIVCEGVE